MGPNSAARKTSQRVLAFLLAVLFLLTTVILWRSAGRAMKMGSGSVVAAASEFDRLKSGDTAKIVLEIVNSAQGNIEGTLLEKKSEIIYKRTGTQVQVVFDANTIVVMGKPADVHAGAVIHLTGAITTNHKVRARQIVILTGYVQVQ